MLSEVGVVGVSQFELAIHVSIAHEELRKTQVIIDKFYYKRLAL